MAEVRIDKILFSLSEYILFNIRWFTFVAPQHNTAQTNTTTSQYRNLNICATNSVSVSLLGFVSAFFPVCWLSRHHQPIRNWLDNVSLWHIHAHFFAEVKFSHNIRIASTYSSNLVVCTLHSIASDLLAIPFLLHNFVHLIPFWPAFSFAVHSVCMPSNVFQRVFSLLLLLQIVCPPYKVRIDCEKFHHRKNSFKTNVIELKLNAKWMICGRRRVELYSFACRCAKSSTHNLIR